MGKLPPPGRGRGPRADRRLARAIAALGAGHAAALARCFAATAAREDRRNARRQYAVLAPDRGGDRDRHHAEPERRRQHGWRRLDPVRRHQQGAQGYGCTDRQPDRLGEGFLQQASRRVVQSEDCEQDSRVRGHAARHRQRLVAIGRTNLARALRNGEQPGQSNQAGCHIFRHSRIAADYLRHARIGVSRSRTDGGKSVQRHLRSSRRKRQHRHVLGHVGKVVRLERKCAHRVRPKPRSRQRLRQGQPGTDRSGSRRGTGKHCCSHPPAGFRRGPDRADAGGAASRYSGAGFEHRGADAGHDCRRGVDDTCRCQPGLVRLQGRNRAGRGVHPDLRRTQPSRRGWNSRNSQGVGGGGRASDRKCGDHGAGARQAHSDRVESADLAGAPTGQGHAMRRRDSLGDKRSDPEQLPRQSHADTGPPRFLQEHAACARTLVGAARCHRGGIELIVATRIRRS